MVLYIYMWENGIKPGTIVKSKTTHRTMGGGYISHIKGYIGIHRHT